MSINYRCEKNLSKSVLRGGRKRGTKIFLGDHPRADRCQLLLSLKVSANHPSQRSYRHPRGYIQFNDGSNFDLFRSTVDGKPRYIFRDHEDIRILAKRLNEQHRLRTLTDGLPDELAPIVAELVLLKAAPSIRASLNPTGAREQVGRHLPSLATADMGAIYDACAP